VRYSAPAALKAHKIARPQHVSASGRDRGGVGERRRAYFKYQLHQPCDGPGPWSARRTNVQVDKRDARPHAACAEHHAFDLGIVSIAGVASDFDRRFNHARHLSSQAVFAVTNGPPGL
jgi:hypothetical protein